MCSFNNIRKPEMHFSYLHVIQMQAMLTMFTDSLTYTGSSFPKLDTYLLWISYGLGHSQATSKLFRDKLFNHKH